ncbi:MAG: hypothetical protein P8Y25_12575 [Chromatiaceae bacterium]
MPYYPLLHCDRRRASAVGSRKAAHQLITNRLHDLPAVPDDLFAEQIQRGSHKPLRFCGSEPLV